MNTRRVLVTGASGFVGRQTLAPLAACGFEVHAVSRKAALQDAGVIWWSADLLDPCDRLALVRRVRPSHVLHCAWMVEHGSFWTAPANLDWVGATIALAREAAECGATRFVGVGTCAEYGWSDNGAAARREEDALAPATLYGEAKAAAFRLLSRYAAQAGLSFAWARLFHLYGPGEPPGRFVSSILCALREGRVAVVRSGPLVRDLMASVDAGAALAALTNSCVEGPVNVASGEPATLEDFARALAEAAGRPHLVEVAPSGAADQPVLMRPDVNRLRREVGFSAAPRSTRIAELIAAAGPFQ